ncbi:uncharacterized protein LOC127810706 isoform X2 [Diospyros lotus]|uniref:uncharacterized protein LOC127810706 isoform X2 n=1 Tax=Diospyros lotus TaxID=55363 RepID=UPI00224D3011|nr:uncharacterized protein LOC127810706 isoform X2 [Diospyros lotus]
METICKCYIVSNLGFAEPCLFLTLVFLLRASLLKTEMGTMSRKRNGKTAGYVLLYCFPVLALQLLVILIGPEFNKDEGLMNNLPHYFTRTATALKTNNRDDVAFCTYPLLSIIFLGLFATALTIYLFWVGKRILNLVINKGLQRRVYTLMLSVYSFFPLRVLFLGLSVLSQPEHFPFEALTFLAFLSLFCCAAVGISMLVYYPIADSLALRNLRETEARRRNSNEYNDTISLVANQSPLEEIAESSPGRSSIASAKRSSISFWAVDKDETSRAVVELDLFSPSHNSTPPGSPQLVGWPMPPPTHVRGS